MSAIKDYQKVVGIIYEQCVAYPDLEQSFENPDTWFEFQNDTLEISAQSLKRILNDLSSNNSILICSIQNFPLMTIEHGHIFDSAGVQLEDSKSILVEYIVTDKIILKNKLINLEESIAGNEPEVRIINSLDDEAIEYEPVGDFRLFTNGSILYKNNPFKCTPYLRPVMLVMLRHEGKTTTFEDVRTALDDETLDKGKISRKINALVHDSLIPVLGYNPVKSERGLGYQFKLRT